MLITEIATAVAPAAPTAALEPITFPDIRDAEGTPKTSRCKPINGRATKLLRKMAAGDADQSLLWQIAAELLPDLTADEVDRLSIDEARDVLAYATGQLAAVEAQIAADAGAPDPPAAAA